ncbi:hypothetical protein V6Z11_A06G189900 [Gossypium hirsutum]
MYLGIRMKNVPTKDIVWIANRDLPFSGSSMILTINEDGYLVIVNGRTSYRVSDDPLSSQNMSATLLDSGNLSFDYPSNTFLPGMKLGYNNKTGKVWSLTSWLDEEDPNNGEFELKMDPKKSNGVFLMKGKGFTLIPEMTLNYIFNYTMYSDENQRIFSYSLYNSSIITRFIIDIDGHMREFVQFCDILNSCGPFSCCNEDTGSCQCLPGFYPSEKQQGQDGGCMRSMPLTCGNGDNKDGFLMMDDVSYPLSSTRQINSPYPFPSGPQVLTNYDVRTCEEVCLTNDPNGGTIFIKLAASEIDNDKGDREDPSQDILLFDMEMSIHTSSSDFSGSENSRKRKRKDSPFPLFSFDSVSLATDNFSSENKLGEGGFGPVYKVRMILIAGKTINGQEIAVKRLSKAQHRNLVRLLGCCLEQGEKILIYEFMPNKSLDSFLLVAVSESLKASFFFFPRFAFCKQHFCKFVSGSDNQGLLDWGTRVRIIEGIAQANTNRIVGTYGYMSPEYAMEGLFSIKSDVFSFGVLLLEIVSGKKSTGFYHSSFLNLMDIFTFKLLIHQWALLCVQEMAADRLTMSEVVSMLTNELTVLNSPKKPAFSNARSTINSSNQPEKFSVNDVTVSLMEPR